MAKRNYKTVSEWKKAYRDKENLLNERGSYATAAIRRKKSRQVFHRAKSTFPPCTRSQSGRKASTRWKKPKNFIQSGINRKLSRESPSKRLGLATPPCMSGGKGKWARKSRWADDTFL